MNAFAPMSDDSALFPSFAGILPMSTVAFTAGATSYGQAPIGPSNLPSPGAAAPATTEQRRGVYPQFKVNGGR